MKGFDNIVQTGWDGFKILNTLTHQIFPLNHILGLIHKICFVFSVPCGLCAYAYDIPLFSAKTKCCVTYLLLPLNI